MIKTRFIEITINRDVEHYEKLGYLIPKKRNKSNRLQVPKGTKLIIDVLHLTPNSNYKIDLICDNCNTEYSIKFQHYLEGQKIHLDKNYCTKCKALLLKKGHDSFIEELNKKYGESEFTILNTIDTCKEKITIRHNNCIDGNQHIFETTPMIMKSKTSFCGCPRCNDLNNANTLRKTQQEFVDEVFKCEGNEYSVVGEYFNSQTKLLMKHNICGTEWEITPSNFIYQANRCPICSDLHKSKGENKIKECLDKFNIIYSKQYRIKECKYKRALPFDFAIFDDEEKTKLKYLIEFQGIQHFVAQTFGGISKERAEDNLKYVQNNDKIKSEYCIKNNIKLIKISYWQFNEIETLIKNLN
jgi:hypothetical protein